MKVVINGAGVAGPALAWWLRRGGHEVLLVEEAREPRRGGYVIDFWGIGYDIAERMGLVARLRDLGYQLREMRFVNEDGKRSGGFSADVFGRLTEGRFTSLRRSDVSATILEALDEGVETLFGDSVAALEDSGDGVVVHFDRSETRRADLVVGADGLHSRVRELAFGPQRDFEVFLDYHVAAFEVEGYGPRDELVYVSHAAPGRQVSRFSMREDKTLVLFVFHDEHLRSEPRTPDERRAALREVFSGVGWECPAILDAMDGADDLYFNRVSQIRMEHWTRGRVALLGDAAACVSLLAGEGTGLAIAEAYVLAGELAAARGDLAAAFAGYEHRLRPFLESKQASAAKFASSFAPRTRLGIGFRDFVTRLLRIPTLADWFLGRDLRDDVELPDYEFR